MVSIEKAKLVESLKKVMPGVEKGSTLINGADQLSFTGTSVSSHNGEIAVTTPCDTQGAAFSVKGADFYALVSRMSDVTLSLDVTDNKVKIKAGRTRASMSLMDATVVKGLVQTLNLDTLQFKPLTEEFVDGVRICTLSNNTENLKGVVVGPFEDTSAIYETDTTRICVSKLSAPMDPFWVDDNTFNDALKVGTPTGYCVGTAWLHLRYADGTIFSAKRRDHSKYPCRQMAEYITALSDARVVVKGTLPSNISEAVSRVAILASGAENKNAKLVQLTFNKSELGLYAEKTGGEASETIPWDKELEEDPQGAQVWVDTAFLLEASNKVMDFMLCYITVPSNPTKENLALVFRSGNYTQFISMSDRA